MWDEVEQYCSMRGENSSGSVCLQYESYGLYVCTIRRAYYKKLPVQAVARTAKEAFEFAKKRVVKVEELEKNIGDLLHIDAKTPNVNKYENGYTVMKVTEDPKDQRRVRYKTLKGEYAIVGLELRDENDYLILEEPKEPSKHFFKVNSRKHQLDEYVEEHNKFLGDKEELYIFDDITQHLSGSAGFGVIKDGKVIKLKTILLS